MYCCYTAKLTNNMLYTGVLGDYTAKFSKIAGTTVLSNSDTIYQNIYDENQCAKLCVDYNGFNCKSFDFCTDIGTCFLGKTHYYDAPQVNIKSDLLCNHWSSKLIDIRCGTCMSSNSPYKFQYVKVNHYESQSLASH